MSQFGSFLGLSRDGAVGEDGQTPFARRGLDDVVVVVGRRGFGVKRGGLGNSFDDHIVLVELGKGGQRLVKT